MQIIYLIRNIKHQ